MEPSVTLKAGQFGAGVLEKLNIPPGVHKRLQHFAESGHRPRVYTCGSFDLMNYGTVSLFKSIKQLIPDCELMVGCYSDQDINDHKGMNVLYESERIKGLQFCKYVDLIYFPAPWIHEFDFFEENEIDFVTGEINGWDLDLLTFEDGEMGEYIQYKQATNQRKVNEEFAHENPSAGLAASLKLKIYANSKFNYLKKMIFSLPSEREPMNTATLGQLSLLHGLDQGGLDEDILPIRRSAAHEQTDSPQLRPKDVCLPSPKPDLVVRRVPDETHPQKESSSHSGERIGKPSLSSSDKEQKAVRPIERRQSDSVSVHSADNKTLESGRSPKSLKASGNYEMSRVVHRSQSSVLGGHRSVPGAVEGKQTDKLKLSKEAKQVFIEKQSIPHMETAKNLLNELNAHDMYLPINVDGRKGASELIIRILRERVAFYERSIKQGYSRQDLNLSFYDYYRLKFKIWVKQLCKKMG